MDRHQLTESEARNVLESYGPAISRRLNDLYAEALAEYANDGIEYPTISTHAFGAWELSQQDIDERLMVPVGELRDGDATAVLMMGVNDGDMEVVYR